MLTIPLEKLAYIVEKAREYDAEVAPEGLQEGSNASDDGERAILEDTLDNPTAGELRGAIQSLNLDEREELPALVWLGRGDWDRKGWREALRQARDTADAHEAEYLLGTPLLADYIEEGLAVFGRSLEGLERG